jgi:hypothetical protein
MARQLNIIRPVIVTTALLTLLSVGFAPAADARGGGRGLSRGFSGHGQGPQFAAGRRHGNDSYIKAASEDRDKLPTNQIKSICRGC